MEYLWIILLLAVAIGVTLLIFKVRRMIRSFSGKVFGVSSLSKGLEIQSQQLAATPKSVSGMTTVYLPQIEKDFPQFNFNEFRHKAENTLRASLLAISTGDLSAVSDASPDLLGQIRLSLEDYRKQGIEKRYERIKIHQTEIARYIKQQGTCVITLQSAVEYLHYIQAGQELISGSREQLQQTKYNVELLYVQDIDKVRSAGSAVGLNCPSCGAPVKQLGNKSCEYCGTGITEMNIHVWSINRFYEVK